MTGSSSGTHKERSSGDTNMGFGGPQMDLTWHGPQMPHNLCDISVAVKWNVILKVNTKTHYLAAL
jgi:hypothetical protein